MNFIDLKRQYDEYRVDIDGRVSDIISRSAFINGREVRELEEKLALYTGAGYAIACSSGTDALLIPLVAYGVKVGDEIITTTFTFIATAEVICFLGAKPVFVDIDERNYNINVSEIEKMITPRTKGIIPVSLFGQTPDMDAINSIAKKYGIFVIEDAAQSFGAVYKGRKSCSLSDVGVTSFYPSKPLGCYGDGGMIFTSNTGLAEKMRSIADHGQGERYIHKYIGLNSRLDTIQAGILLAKFSRFEEEAIKRADIGKRYSELLKGSASITPFVESYTDRHIYAQYSLRVKNRLETIKNLTNEGIPTAIHYPIPIHLQEAYRYLIRFPSARRCWAK
jgi:UDP-2-acetamido-2-deoxy-ribo-hexuluronate aminotransferase